MFEASQNWELFGYDMRKLGRHWVASWRDLLWAHDSPVRQRMDEAIRLTSAEGDFYYQGGRPVAPVSTDCNAVVLPEELVLVKRLVFPVAVEADIDAVMALEVSSNSPFSASDTGSGWQIFHRDDGSFQVILAIVSLSAVMAYLGREYDSHTAGAQEVWYLENDVPIVLQGFGEHDRARRYRLRLIRAVGLASIAAVILLLIAVTSVTAKRAESVHLKTLARVVSSEAADESEMRSAISMGNDISVAANQIIEQYPRPYSELARLTTLLDDEAFLERFKMNGSDIDIRGRALDAAAVMKKLTAQSEYAEVNATRAISRIGNTGQEQFHLKIRLAGEGSQ